MGEAAKHARAQNADNDNADDGLPELVKAERVAEWLCLEDKRCVYDMVARGELPQDCLVRLSPRRLRFDAVRLRAWIAEKRASSRESPR